MQQYRPGGDIFSTMYNDPFFSQWGAPTDMMSLLPFLGGASNALAPTLGGLQQRMQQLPSMKLDVRENERAIEILADVPGVKKEVSTRRCAAGSAMAADVPCGNTASAPAHSPPHCCRRCRWTLTATTS